MDSDRKAVRVVGILFLVQMAAAVLSYSVILDPILYSQGFLTELASSSALVTLAVILDITCGASVFAIAVILFPLLKRYSERVALWYAGLRLTELVAFMVGGVFLLTLLTMGQDLAGVAGTEAARVESQAGYLRDARGSVQNIALLAYGLGAWSFYGLLYRSRLLPRFIPVWGILAVTLLEIEIVSNIFGTSAGGIMIMMPLGLNEVFLGVWLIVRGFNDPASERPVTPHPA